MTTVDMAAQVRAVCQAVLLGGGLGVVYDLMRVVRRRVPLGWLGSVLDLLFWTAATATLFVFSHGAWGGEIRLYGAAFFMLGGWAYFWGLSPLVLGVALAAVRVLELVLGILTAPARAAGRLLKRIAKKVKNIFPFKEKWSMIKPKPKV